MTECRREKIEGKRINTRIDIGENKGHGFVELPEMIPICWVNNHPDKPQMEIRIRESILGKSSYQ